MNEGFQNRVDFLEYKNRVAESEIGKLREQAKRKGKLFLLLNAVGSFAAGISIHLIDAAHNRETTNQNVATINTLSTKLSALQFNAEQQALAQSYKIQQLEKSKQHIVTQENEPRPYRHYALTRGSYEERIEFLTELVGSDYIQYVVDGNFETEASFHSHIELSKDVSITGSHKYMTNEELTRYIQGYPSEWIQGKVSKIRIHSENYGASPSYAKQGKTIGTFSGWNDTLDIYGAIINETNLTAFDRTVAHEIGHGNDWIRNSKISSEARIELLAKVAARLLSDDRFHSNYVESIETTNPQTTLSHKYEEYFAEIVAAYFSNPTELHYKDYQIVHDLVTQQSPNYDIEDGKLRRVRAFDSIRQL